MSEHKKDYIFFICSDVTIDKVNYSKMIEKIKNNKIPQNFGVYSPATIGKCHNHCKPMNRNIRKVPFVEGFFFFTKKNILDNFLPVDIHINKLGWGLDIAKGFFSETNNLSCYIDDNIIIKHPEGTGYSSDDAMIQFKTWAKSLNNKNFLFFIKKHMNIIIN
jgi:hypothetical protein